MTELASGLTATDDERLAQAESVVRAHCGWHIAPSRNEVVTLDSTGPDLLLLLPTLKLTGVTSVVADGQEVTPDTYEWDPEGWLRRTGYRLWCVRPGRVTVTFTHGYDAPPPDVTAVVQALATRAIANPGSVIRTQVGPFADTYSQTAVNQVVPMALLDAERALLAPYVLPKRP